MFLWSSINQDNKVYLETLRGQAMQLSLYIVSNPPVPKEASKVRLRVSLRAEPWEHQPCEAKHMEQSNSYRESRHELLRDRNPSESIQVTCWNLIDTGVLAWKRNNSEMAMGMNPALLTTGPVFVCSELGWV
ncbi:hypothetical protein ARMSODRAFT_981791 [Armillaria solidipes]|uniref:Uncharacterized protein n=1 Tax=Armillaria solidipes TaxID=1076256 RepID=A0A2H3AQH4_9AGAR|nr:hypothetical protein ARMSODRAFT_981791 [Armillaria solidipes]